MTEPTPAKKPNPGHANLTPGWTDEHRAKAAETRRRNKEAKWPKFIAALENGDAVSVAAKKAQLTKAELKAAEQDPVKWGEWVDAEAVGAEPVEAALRAAALSGNVQAANQWLQNRASSRWKGPGPAVVVDARQVHIDAAPGGAGTEKRIEGILKMLARLEDRMAQKALPAGGEEVIDV